MSIDLNRIRAAASEREALLAKATPGEWKASKLPRLNTKTRFVMACSKYWDASVKYSKSAIDSGVLFIDTEKTSEGSSATASACLSLPGEDAPNNFDFIAHAKNTAAQSIADVRELCDEVERLRTVLGAAKDALASLWNVGGENWPVANALREAIAACEGV